MSLECYPYSSEMRELTGRLKRADISRELDARVERDGVSVVVVEVRDAQNGSCVGADRAGPPDAPGSRASDRTPRPSYSVSKAMLRAAAARADPLGYDRDRELYRVEYEDGGMLMRTCLWLRTHFARPPLRKPVAVET